jgi:hypothetical protein
MQGEISYDLLMEADMSFVAGTYRVDNGGWQVFIIGKDPINRPEVTSGSWDSGVTGVFVRVPPSFHLNKQVVEQLLSGLLRVGEWREVKGPDSLQLR